MESGAQRSTDRVASVEFHLLVGWGLRRDQSVAEVKGKRAMYSSSEGFQHLALLAEREVQSLATVHLVVWSQQPSVPSWHL